MEPQISQKELKELIYSILPEIIEKYFQEREKELHAISLIERLIRVEEELKALRIDTNTRFESLMREMEARFEAQKKDSDAKFETLIARFEAQRKDSDAKFEAINARFESLMREMDARFEAINARFESLEKRLNFIQWFMGIWFTIIVLVITLFNFLKS